MAKTTELKDAAVELVTAVETATPKQVSAFVKDVKSAGFWETTIASALRVAAKTGIAAIATDGAGIANINYTNTAILVAVSAAVSIIYSLLTAIKPNN